MVGDPKTLADLRRIEAGVQVTCRDCGRVSLLDRERLIADLLRRRRSLSWDILPAQLRCACGSKGAEIRPLPFADRDTLPAMVNRLVLAAERRLVSLVDRDGSVASLSEISAATLEFQQAKEELIAWAADRPNIQRRTQ